MQAYFKYKILWLFYFFLYGSVISLSLSWCGLPGFPLAFLHITLKCDKNLVDLLFSLWQGWTQLQQISSNIQNLQILKGGLAGEIHQPIILSLTCGSAGVWQPGWNSTTDMFFIGQVKGCWNLLCWRGWQKFMNKTRVKMLREEMLTAVRMLNLKPWGKLHEGWSQAAAGPPQTENELIGIHLIPVIMLKTTQTGSGGNVELVAVLYAYRKTRRERETCVVCVCVCFWSGGVGGAAPFDKRLA